MNDQNRMKFIFFGGVGAVIVLFLSIAIVVSHFEKKAPGYTTRIVDKDTGEVLNVQPNQTPETEANSGIILFGAKQLFEAGATSDQFSLVKQVLTKYATSNLGGKYQTLTFIPAYFKSNSGVMTGKLRLGETGNLVDFKITLSQLKFVQVMITDSLGQNGGNYDSGKLTVSSPPQ